MASGSFSSGGSSYIEVEWNSVQNGQNSSIVSAYLYVNLDDITYGNTVNAASRSCSISINGTNHNFTDNYQISHGKSLVVQFGLQVNHDSNGYANINISASFNIGDITFFVVDQYGGTGGFYFTDSVGSLIASQFVTLDTINKAAAAPGAPEWGPNVSTYIANPGDVFLISWGGGGGMGMSGSYPATFAFCELQRWDSDSYHWTGTIWQDSIFESYQSMPSISRGGVVQYRVRVWNNLGLCGNWAYTSSITCNVLPTAPTSVSGSPANFEPGTNVILSWSGQSGGSYSISSYHTQYSTDGITWTDWNPQDLNTSKSSTTLFITRGKTYQFRVSLTNSGGYSTAWSTIASVTVNNAPTAPTSITTPSIVYLSNPNVSFVCSGAAAGAGSITEYDFDVQDTAGGGWVNVYQGPTARCAINLSSFLTLSPAHTLQARVRIKNSYNVYSSYLVSSNITIQGGITHINEGGTWKTGIVYVRIAGVWKQAVSVYIKEGGNWKQGL
jgi:hypothetical protein